MTTDFPTEWASTTLRVRYAETDQMGVVYYANYMVWFEIGRTEFCRQHGFEYRDMERDDGLCIIVAEASCRYKASAQYDDEVLVKTCLRAVRRRIRSRHAFTTIRCSQVVTAESPRKLAARLNAEINASCSASAASSGSDMVRTATAHNRSRCRANSCPNASGSPSTWSFSNSASLCSVSGWASAGPRLRSASS